MNWTLDIVNFAQQEQSPTLTDTPGFTTHLVGKIYYGLEIMFYSFVLAVINVWMIAQELLKKKKRKSLKG